MKMPKRRTGIIICVAMVLLSLLMCNQVMFAETIPTDGLVAYYPFNGNANDESGNRNHGTIYGATAAADRFGIQNKAYSFDRINDFITVNTNQFSITQSLSVSVWILNTDTKFTDDTYGGASNYVISKGVFYITPYNDYYMNLQYNRDLQFHIINESGTMYTVAGKLTDNIYHHIVGIYDYANSKLKLYIDGTLVQEISASGRIKNSNNSFYIGDWNGSSSWHFWKGLIDDVRIYNRALSDSEVRKLNYEGGPPTPNLIQNPNFDNGIENWYCVNNAPNAQANPSWDTADYATTPGSLKVQCYIKGNSYKDLQLLTSRFNLIKDRTYLLTFKAKSSANFTIPYIKLNQAVAPWNDYALPYTGLPITASGGATGWQDYAAIFTANSTVGDARLTFFLGGSIPNGATLNIDNVYLKEITVNPPPAGELLSNPGFDLGVRNWHFYADEYSQANHGLDPTDYDSAPVSYKIQCIHNDWVNSIQLYTMPLSISQGKTYRLTFKAKCTNRFPILYVRLIKATSPWDNYAPSGEVAITPGWQSYTVDFTAYTTAPDGRITFFFAFLPDGATFWIDSVSLREVGQ